MRRRYVFLRVYWEVFKSESHGVILLGLVLTGFAALVFFLPGLMGARKFNPSDAWILLVYPAFIVAMDFWLIARRNGFEPRKYLQEEQKKVLAVVVASSFGFLGVLSALVFLRPFFAPPMTSTVAVTLAATIAGFALLVYYLPPLSATWLSRYPIPYLEYAAKVLAGAKDSRPGRWKVRAFHAVRLAGIVLRRHISSVAYSGIESDLGLRALDLYAIDTLWEGGENIDRLRNRLGVLVDGIAEVKPLDLTSIAKVLKEMTSPITLEPNKAKIILESPSSPLASGQASFASLGQRVLRAAAYAASGAIFGVVLRILFPA